MRKAASKYLFERKGTFYVRIPVPKHVRTSYGRNEIQKSLGTKSLTEAVILMGPWVDFYTRDFNGERQEEISPTALRSTATVHGTSYQHVDQIVTTPIEESVQIVGPGIESLGRMNNPTALDYAAVGGTHEPPTLTIRQAWEEFDKDSPDLWFNLSHRDQQKKKNKYKEAVSDWEREMGKDVDVLKLTKKDIYDYRGKLLVRVENGSLKVNSVRKKLMWQRVIVRHAYDIRDMKDSPFENLRPIKGKGDEEKRPVITEDEVKAVRRHFADVEANDQLRAIISVMENTGAHAKELVFLTENDIHLDAPIPYISIDINEHRSFLKTDNRIRDVPLVGVALDAMRQFPKGFPRYRRDNGSEALSAAANKLIQTVAPKKVTYSYRHRLAQLMKAHKVEDTLREAIMGWGSDGKMAAHYGEQYPLSVKLEVLRQVLPEHAHKL
ncbi:DUF6538 domain-containing protein [Neorhizobium sp. IRS_2295]|uniref:DUF6538 domain-containing protein n=1 Tax=Neorhizobium sp. IRS_2295 TaxID=3421959 RepID=UPI003D290B30